MFAKKRQKIQLTSAFENTPTFFYFIKDEIDEILKEVEQVAISTLDLPYTSTYVMDYLASKKSKRPRFGNLEDIQEVLSQESYSSSFYNK